MSDATSQIRAVLQTYEKALNDSDTDAAVGLYAEDGVFMPQNSPPSIGLPSIRKAYDAVFGAITLSVTFDVSEVVPVSDEWAFARTRSSGTVTVHGAGAAEPEANQELFVFQNVGGFWKIARYCFSTTNPPRA